MNAAQANRNIELKAFLPSPDEARATAARLATAGPETQHQVDTYFHCRDGRLKLREIDGQAAQLVWYHRSDQADAKASDYTLLPAPNAAGLREALTAACGVLVVVEKSREIYLYHNVRIHLDQVRGLGTYLEFEAVLGGDVDDAQGHAQVAWLQHQFGVRPADLIDHSYSDLMRRSWPQAEE